MYMRYIKLQFPKFIHSSQQLNLQPILTNLVMLQLIHILNILVFRIYQQMMPSISLNLYLIQLYYL